MRTLARPRKYCILTPGNSVTTEEPTTGT
jgi:hypothetical protein